LTKILQMFVIVPKIRHHILLKFIENNHKFASLSHMFLTDALIQARDIVWV